MTAMKPGGLVSILAVALLVPAAPASSQAREGGEAGNAGGGASVRQALESLEAHLDRAVARVSVPHTGILLGRADATRGYRLPGYGILFVLAPRALPGEDAVYFLRRGHRHDVRVDWPPPAPDDEPSWEPERVEELERQVLILQHVAEAERRAAEEEMERIVRNVRIRLAPPPLPAPGEPGAPPSPGDEAGPPAPPALPGEMELPASPPWKFWFEAGAPGEGRAPDRVVAEVKSAVIEALLSRAEGVAGLGADEFVTVAVDFVPGGLFASHPRPSRTLVVRVRQRDLEAQAGGILAPAEVRERVEVIEY